MAKMVKIKYNGPIGTHFVTSPMRQVATYGLHTRGDIFEVYPADQKAKPEVFVPYEEPMRAEPVVATIPEVVQDETEPEVVAVAEPVVEEKPAPIKKKGRPAKK